MYPDSSTSLFINGLRSSYSSRWNMPDIVSVLAPNSLKRPKQMSRASFVFWLRSSSVSLILTLNTSLLYPDVSYERNRNHIGRLPNWLLGKMIREIHIFPTLRLPKYEQTTRWLHRQKVGCGGNGKHKPSANRVPQFEIFHFV